MSHSELEQIEAERDLAVSVEGSVFDVIEHASNPNRADRRDYSFPREWELEGQLHRTRQDAYREIQKARMGSLVSAHPEYLNGLIEFIYQWKGEIETELAAIEESVRQAAENLEG